eukprot:1192791-Prorocentrum_minimum.AAC.3
MSVSSPCADCSQAALARRCQLAAAGRAASWRAGDSASWQSAFARWRRRRFRAGQLDLLGGSAVGVRVVGPCGRAGRSNSMFFISFILYTQIARLSILI